MLAIGVMASIVGVALTLALDWFPPQASTAAEKVDSLYDVLLIASVPVFVLVMTIAIYSVVKFRAKPGDQADGAPIHGNTLLEIVWVTIPFLLVTGLAIYGYVELREIEAEQPDTMIVDVTGRQFAWSFEYPQEGDEPVSSNELVMPIDQPVEFRIEALDVIHSFWVPAFRLKSDAVPGITTSYRITAREEGSFPVVCAELCGIGHSTMRQTARVVPRDEFDSWLSEQAKAAEEQGEAAAEPAPGGSAEQEPAAASAGDQPRPASVQ
jgi:cytochrome c oxidase subunit 2